MRKNKLEYNAYMLEYQKKRYVRRRQESIVALGGKCASCGSTETLEFDHINASEKTYDIAKLFGGASEAKLQTELKKCQLLCGKCHADKTYSVGGDQKSVEHGGGSSGKRNCPCEPCKTRKAEYMKIYMQNRRTKAP